MTEKQQFPLIVKTISGLEDVLMAELEELGAMELIKLNRAVSFMGNQEMMYRTNYLCRTALRILRPLFHFEITDQQDLYEHIHAFPWEEYISPENSIAIDGVISYTVFTNSQFVAQRSKDAIVDRFRGKFDRRPSVDLENPDIRINVHLFKDNCTVSLDSSGPSLHRRGYRKSTGPAPISEVLAAGLIRLTGWEPAIPLYDPMCGSGTILIEAAMAARSVPAGYYRKNWGFMHWRDFDPALWQSVVEKANASINLRPVFIHGSDKSRMAIDSALENLRLVGFEKDITLETTPFSGSKPPFKSGMILANPPYDERIRIEDSMGFYRMIGDTMKQKYAGYTAWLISGDLESVKFIGLRPSRKIKVFNGPLECRFLRFELFEGKKGSKEEGSPGNM